MAVINIFPETTFPSDQFSLDSLLNVYFVNINPATFQLEAGNKYKVVWDGNEYECEGQDASSIAQMTACIIGNGTAYGLKGNNEPFVILYLLDNNAVSIASLTDTEPTEHTIAIFEDIGEKGKVEKTLTFAEDTMFGTSAMLGTGESDNLVAITEEPYTITWDGQQHTLYGTYLPLYGALAFGNLSILNSSYENTGESFLIACAGKIFGALTTETGNTHTIGISVEVPQFETIIDNTIYSEFQEIASGAYYLLSNQVLNIVKDKVYYVYWDGVIFKVTGESTIFDGVTTNYLGNSSITDNESTDESSEPFLIASVPTGSSGETKVLYIATTSAKPAHEIGFFEVESPIILKDRNGQDTEYAEAQKIKVNMADGTSTLWINEATIPTQVEKEVQLDLSSGNQTVTPGFREVFSSVVIQKPTTLLPENIKNGINIAGVQGEFDNPVEISTEITPNFAQGNVVVTPETGKVFSEVTVVKPTNLIPENIKKATQIAGIDGNLTFIEDVATENEMDAVLTENNVGNAFRFTGTTTNNYISGDIYVVEAST